LDSAFLTGRYHTARERYVTESNERTRSFAVVYVSRATNPDRPHDQLRALREACASRNFRAGVSSALLLQDGMFCQWLQGEEANVLATLERIQRDPRHEALMVLFHGNAPTSMLDVWCMGMRSLYMAQGEAFQRAQRLRFQAAESAFSGPLDAWLDFAGVTHPELAIRLAADVDVSKGVSRPVCLLGLRSALGGQVLLDAVKGERGCLGVVRWAAAADLDCDLQTVGGMLPFAGAPAHVSSVSARSLRVGAVREVMRHRKRWAILLSQDDVGELDHLISAVERNAPPGFVPDHTAVIARTWEGDSARHAQQMLDARGWAGYVHTLDVMKRGAWKKLGEMIPA
jgi:hypothetical protein